MNLLKRIARFLNESQSRIYDVSGLRLIWFKIRPPEGEFKRRPSSFLFWVIGLYVAFYGLASQRYMEQLARVEYEFNLSVAQLSTKGRKAALTRLAQIQRKEIPIEPQLFGPNNPVLWLHDTETPKKFVTETAAIIVSEKNDLKGANLGAINLSGVSLSRAHMELVKMRGADLRKAYLKGTDLRGADLEGADFRGADLTGADLRATFLPRTSLKGADLTRAQLSGAMWADESNCNSDSIGKCILDICKGTQQEWEKKIDPGALEWTHFQERECDIDKKVYSTPTHSSKRILLKDPNSRFIELDEVLELFKAAKVADGPTKN